MHLHLMEDRPCILFHVLQILRTPAQPHEKPLLASVLPPKLFQICQTPQHVQPLDFCTLFWSHSMVSVVYLAPWLAMQAWISALALALLLVQGKACIPGFLSSSEYSIPTLAPRLQALAPTHLTSIAAYLCLILSP